MTPIEWDNLSSGLIGAIFGSIIGFLGSVFLNWWNQRTEREAAAHAILAEMFTNATRALDAESTLVLHPFVDSAWRSQLPSVAHLIKWPDLKILLEAYDAGFKAYENAADTLRAARERPKAPFDELHRDKELLKIKEWLMSAAKEWLRAIDILRGPALRPRDRTKFDDDFRKLKRRANSNHP